MSCESSITDLTMEMMEDDCREVLLSHIKELHEAVIEMKGAFTTAQLQLVSTISAEDESRTGLRAELEGTRSSCERTSGDILQLVLALKGDLTCVKEAFVSNQFFQQSLQSSLQIMLAERDLLLEELAKTGAISEGLRTRLHSGCNLSDEARPSSGSHSHQSSASNGSNDNDSGVALLLEKAQSAFQPLLQQELRASANKLGGVTGGVAVDLASLAANHSANANVQEYLNGLGQRRGRNSSQGQGARGKGSKAEIGSEDLPLTPFNGVVYDSDCSLTLAATKSLSLSNSLSKQCGLELDHEQNTVLVQLQEKESSCLKGGSISDQEEGLNFNEGQRYKVAKELLETERKYCHTLRTIQETFAFPLKSSGVLSLKDINTLFPEEVFSLYEKHIVLLAQLEERIISWKSTPRIGDILERFTHGKGSDVLRLYRNYVNDFPEVLKTFHKLCRNSREFTHFLKTSLEHPTCRGLDLGSFLLSPVQRMPRYILLLKQILKYTPSSHPDHGDITVCLHRLRDYLKRLNDSMEHSFQLVTAQISPPPPPPEDEGSHGPDSGGDSEGKKIGFTNALGLGGFVFGSRKMNGGSISSGSSHSTGERGSPPKIRYKRSTSVPRSVQRANIPHAGCPPRDEGLGNRSKSEWAVCTECNCGSNQIPPPPRPDCEDDSDLETEDRTPATATPEGQGGRKFSTSKSLHDFPASHPDWFCSQEDLLDKAREPGQNANSVTVPPTLSGGGGHYVARIQRARGSESEMNLHMIGLKGSAIEPNLDTSKKKTSLRTSLKNIFSLKKRYKIKYPSSASYRVLYSDKKVAKPSTCQQQHGTVRTLTKSELRTSRTLQISGPILPSKTTPFPPRDLPIPAVTTLRYTNGLECYQSLPPEPVHQPPELRMRVSQPERRGPSCSPSLPPQPHPQAPGGFRYSRNPAGAKLGNPKLPKTPFMTKYQQFQGRASPYTDV